MRKTTFLLAVFVVGCGRTEADLSESGDAADDVSRDGPPAADAGGDAGRDAAPSDASTEAANGGDGAGYACPLTAPVEDASCEDKGKILCLYTANDVPTLDGLTGWCCNKNSRWDNCTDKGRPSLGAQMCEDVPCVPGDTVECVIGSGSRCCVCSPDAGTLQNCGPC